MINKLFVYGTLLQGGNRNHLLSDWKLTDTLLLNGRLHDTGSGYPAADFSAGNSTIFGELYSYYHTDIEKQLSILDTEEGIGENLYKRINLHSDGHDFYAYNINDGLLSQSNSLTEIKSGNWRQHSLSGNKDIEAFSLNFEKVQSKRYRLFPDDDLKPFVHLEGNIPILLVSSHATAHMRKGKLKSQELYTAAINTVLNSTTGAHSIYTVYASEQDSNYCEQTDLKNLIADVIKKYKIRVVLDLHGTGSYRKFDIYPGIGKTDEFLCGHPFIIENLHEIMSYSNISIGSTDVFPAYRQHTVSRFIYSKLTTPAIQIEINKKLRDPENNPVLFLKLIESLGKYINIVSEYFR